MGCPGCEIHNAIYGVTKKSSARPKDAPIPTSSKRIRPELINTPALRFPDRKDTPSPDNPTADPAQLPGQ